MEINVTIVVQAIQFGCVYYFLYKFLFVPACKILDEQEQVKQNLYQNLEQAQQIKDALLQDYHVKHDAFKSILLQNVPEQAVESVYQKSKDSRVLDCDEQFELSQQEKQNIKEFLVNNLSKVIKQ